MPCLRARSFTSSRQPLFPSHEFHADAVIVDDEISAVILPDGAGLNFLHFLCHDAHVKGVIAASVAEAIELEAVVEPPQREDVFLEADVGTTPAATPTTAATAPSAMDATTAAMYATSTVCHVPSVAYFTAVMSYMVTGPVTGMMCYMVAGSMMRMVRNVVSGSMTRMMRHVVTSMAPTMPANGSAPPQSPHPRTVAAYVPSRSIPAAFVPAISATVPDVLRVLDQSRIACRGV